MAETNKKTEELAALRKSAAERSSPKADEIAALKKTTAEASRKCDEMVKELATMDELKKSLAEKTKRVDEVTREKNNFEAYKKLFHREIDRLKKNLQEEQDGRKADSKKAASVLEKSRQEAQRNPTAAAKAQEEGKKAAKRIKREKRLFQKASKGLALAKSYKRALQALVRKRQNRPRKTKQKRRSRVALTPALQVVRKARVASSVATTSRGKRKEAPTGAASSAKTGGTGGGERQQAKYSRGADVASAITKSLTDFAAKATGYGYGASTASSGTGSSIASAKTSSGCSTAAKIGGGMGKAVLTPPGTHSISKSNSVTKGSQDAVVLVDLEAES